MHKTYTPTAEYRIAEGSFPYFASIGVRLKFSEPASCIEKEEYAQILRKGSVPYFGMLARAKGKEKKRRLRFRPSARSPGLSLASHFIQKHALRLSVGRDHGTILRRALDL